MSLMLMAAAMMSASLPGSTTGFDRSDWRHVVAAARRADMASVDLYRALTAPVAPRRSADEARLCIRSSDIVPAKAGLVCRTRDQWADLGIEITATDG